jgi:tight adherence protein B
LVNVTKFIQLRLQQAGLASSAKAKIAGVLLPLLVFAAVQDAFRVLLLSISSCVAVLAIELELLNSKAQARRKQIEEEWPTVLESLESAAQSAMSLIDSLRDLAESAHLVVAKDFAFACSLCDRGVSLDEALSTLKPRFALATCDSTIELLRLVNDSGGAGFISALRHQASAIRQESNIAQQIAAKQGWVIGTAKIAVAAPWLIVALLATRPENARAYASVEGSLLLLFGLLASIFAIRLITLIGTIDRSQRVLA